jgi:histidinol dehydrogenase
MKLKTVRSGSAEFKRLLNFIRARGDAGGAGVEAAVANILNAVKRRGDRAVIEFTARHDQVRLTTTTLRVSASELKAARDALNPEERRALELAARRIRDFHVRTMDQSFSYRDRLGMRLGQVVRPLERAGIYVPGGHGAYPSSVLMNAIPARVAGVREIVMVSPSSPDGERGSVLAAAAIAGVDEVYRIGGAQAVAALAYGTETIRPVDKIVGPGNAYVQAAKRMVYGVVDIDKIAGPSEVVVIADDSARAEWVAADLIAQAEHGSGDEAAVLLTPSRRLAEAVAVALDQALLDLPRAESVRKVLTKRGGLIVVRDLEEAFAIANRIAPEHLELEIRHPERWIGAVKSAGAVFLGSMSSAALGDYVAGPNHVLPTGGAARFSSPLGAYDFVKRSSIIQATTDAVRRLGPSVARLARMEGFEAHARAIELRLNQGAGERRRRNSRGDGKSN